jgi:hypothetical protein
MPGMSDTKRFDAINGIDLSDAVGFFSWNVKENKVYGDQVFAFIYEVPYRDLESGAPIEQVILYVDDGDKQRVAKALHESIISGKKCHQSYGITHRNGRRITVTGQGRCLRDNLGLPSIYTGSVTAVEVGKGARSGDPLEIHCLEALKIANSRRHALAARYLSSALNVLDGGKKA